MSAENGRLRYVHRFCGEVLSEEYSRKKSCLGPSKEILIWTTISFDGPEQFFYRREREHRCL
jgi:hypothetical protein